MTTTDDPTGALYELQRRIHDYMTLGAGKRSDEEDRIAQDAARIAGGEYRPAYNGWTNRETWNASLWIGNDAGTYETARDIVRDALSADPYPSLRAFTGSAPDDPDSVRRAQLSRAGDALREWWDEANAPGDASPLSDAWSYAVDVTDWTDVAEGLAEDIRPLASGVLLGDERL